MGLTARGRKRYGLVCMAAVCAVFAAVLAWACPAYAEPAGNPLLPAASGGVVNKVFIKYGTNFYSKTVNGYDITGDGKADAIKFQAVEASGSYSDYYASALRIYVNGKLAKTVRYKENGYSFDFYRTGVYVKYLRMRNGKPFLFVKCDANNGDGQHEVLQYRGGKLQAVLTGSFVPKGYYGAHRQISDVTAKGNTLRAKFVLMSYAASLLEMNYTFKSSGSKLKVTSSATSNIAYYSMSSSKKGKPYGKAMSKFKAYANTSLRWAKFTVKKGQKFRYVGACIKNKKLYMKVQTAGGKTGWIKAPKKYFGNGKSLIGTWLAG